MECSSHCKTPAVFYPEPFTRYKVCSVCDIHITVHRVYRELLTTCYTRSLHRLSVCALSHSKEAGAPVVGASLVASSPTIAPSSRGIGRAIRRSALLKQYGGVRRAS